MMMPMMMGAPGSWLVWFGAGLAIAGLGWAVIHRRGTQSMGDRNHSSPPDPLAIARERYARGLISKDEFEHIIAELLRTEREE